MKTAEEVRRARLLELKDEFKSFAAINEKLGRLPKDSTLSQIASMSLNSKTLKPKLMGPEQARLLESVLGKPVGWMDTDPDLLRSNAGVSASLDSWSEHASPRSREVIDQLHLLAQKNALGDEEWDLISQLALRFQSKPKAKTKKK